MAMRSSRLSSRHILSWSGRLWLPMFAASAVWIPVSVRAQQSEAITGVPQQIIPQAGEMGLGNFTLPTGTATAFSVSGSSSGGSSGTGSSTSSDALDTMMATSWGSEAAEEAEGLGVNSTALAATCLIESGCQNVSGSGTITGAFQMSSSTFESMYAAALAANPSLASTTTDDANDPASEAAAAAEYLQQGAQYLEKNGISDPTVLDVRGYYNFGPAGGAALANASDDESASQVLSRFSAATLAANGITSGETVGEWRTATAAKLGNAASAPVLT